MGLAGYEDVPLSQLSAGQQRRVALTRLWLMLCDAVDPDELLDAPTRRVIETLSRRLEQHVLAGGSAILTTHQPLRPLICALRTLRLGVGEGNA